MGRACIPTDGGPWSVRLESYTWATREMSLADSGHSLGLLLWSLRTQTSPGPSRRNSFWCVCESHQVGMSRLHPSWQVWSAGVIDRYDWPVWLMWLIMWLVLWLITLPITWLTYWKCTLILIVFNLNCVCAFLIVFMRLHFMPESAKMKTAPAIATGRLLIGISI